MIEELRQGPSADFHCRCISEQVAVLHNCGRLILKGCCVGTARRPTQHRREENYFFALSKYQSQLEQLLTENEGFVEPSYRRNEVLGWVKEGVRDFSISR